MRIHAFSDPDPDPKHCPKGQPFTSISEGAFTPCQGLVLKSGLGTRHASFPHQDFPPFPHLAPPPPHVSSVGREGE
jgi:hypothetical protein